jgi:hypothetical protein
MVFCAKTRHGCGSVQTMPQHMVLCAISSLNSLHYSPKFAKNEKKIGWKLSAHSLPGARALARAARLK